jgi:predicted DsbA family dithiol-disulfide isomerase
MLKGEFGDTLDVVWRSFLLRPRPDPGRTLDEFRAYTRRWERVGSQPDSGVFRVWESDEGPPSHSVPPHLAAKAAATFGDDAFERFHDRLFSAYFAENRDITAPGTLAALWEEVGLPAGGLSRAEDPALERQVLEEHNEAVACGADGVPAFRTEGTKVVITGAHPVDFFRQWVDRVLGAAK